MAGNGNGHRAGCLLLQLGVQIVHRSTMAFINYVAKIQFDFGALSLLKAECERVASAAPWW
jgi:hypothetical protein